MARPSASRLAACFLVGAVLGTALDAIHVHNGVLVYHGATIGDIGWWVPLQFGVVGALVGLAIPVIERSVGVAEPPTWRVDQVVGELMLFAVLYLSTALVSADDAGWLTAGLFALAGVRLALVPTQGDWAYVLLAAVLGPLGEAAVSATGVFEYVDPDFLGIPYWLPALWANGGFLLRRLLLPVVSRA